MDPRRAQVERNAHFSRGPRFFREADAVMFEFVIDAGNVIGPRPATAGDEANHAQAWATFQRADALAELARDDADEIMALGVSQGPPARRAYRRKSQDQAA